MELLERQQIWAKSQHSCSEVLQPLDSIREIHEIRMTTDNKEKDGRMKAGLIDKVKLQNFLETCLHPLNCFKPPREYSLQYLHWSTVRY